MSGEVYRGMKKSPGSDVTPECFFIKLFEEGRCEDAAGGIQANMTCRPGGKSYSEGSNFFSEKVPPPLSTSAP